MSTDVTTDILIATDNLLERNEAFYVTIDSSSVQNNVVIGHDSIATILILDDDRK